jgi:hypothetical protein
MRDFVSLLKRVCCTNKWRCCLILIAIALLFPVLSFGYSFLTGDDVSGYVYRKTISVDIHSGRIMKKTIMCGFTLDHKIEDTLVSRLLQKNQMIEEIPVWRLDCEFTLFSPRISPHFRFHGIASELRMFDWIVDWCPLSEESQMLIAIATQKRLNDFNEGNVKKYGSTAGLRIEKFDF